jgi:hypothetical protein
MYTAPAIMSEAINRKINILGGVRDFDEFKSAVYSGAKAIKV